MRKVDSSSRTSPLPASCRARLGPGALSAVIALLGAGSVSAQELVIVPGVTVLQNLPGQNAARRDMARSIDAVCPTLASNAPLLTAEQTDLRQVCTRMIQTATNGPNSYGLDDDELNDALQSIAGEELQTPETQLNDAREGQVTNLRGRLAALRAGPTGGLLSTAGLYLDTGREVLVASNDDTFLPEGLSEVASDRLGLFITGGLGFGDRDQTSELGAFDFDTMGVTAGADYRLTDQLILGVALGFSVFDADFDSTRSSPSGQKLESDTYTLSLYGTYYPTQNLFFDAVASIARSDYDSRRRIVIESQTNQPSEDRTARGDFDAMLYGVALNAGYDVPFANGLTLTPTVGLDYQYADIDDFEEDGAGGLNLAFGDQQTDSLTGSLGLQASYPWSLPFGVLVPTVRAAWVYEFHDDDDGVRVQYASDPTGLSAFDLTTISGDASYGVIGGGLALALPQGFSLFAEYDTVVGLDDLNLHRVSAGLRKTF